MWLVFWLAVGVAFVMPESLTRLANLLGIGRGADLVLYVFISCGTKATAIRNPPK